MKATKQKTEQTVVYCGPDIKNSMRKFAVYQGGLPLNVAEMVEKNPLLGKLIVPVSELANTRAAISEPGTPQNIYYNKILAGGES